MYHRYAQQDSRWYEPIDRYSPDPELLAVHRRLVPREWPLRRRGIWYIVNPPGATLVRQGWKLHVSTHPDRAEQTLADALGVLVEQRVPFKFLLDRRSVTRTLAKSWSRGSSGKFVTVYPEDDDRFLRIAKELADAVGDTGGPHLLSDRPVPGSTSVFYRYGGFIADTRLGADGVPSLVIQDPDGNDVPDYRQPYYSVPAWATDPFGEPDPDPGVPELDGGRYRIQSALAFSNAGGVYLATDTADGSTVVIKEARPGLVVGEGVSAIEALEREYGVLTRLADAPHFVRPRRLFAEGGHSFLVEERVTGPQASTRAISTNPIHTLDLSGDALRTYFQGQRRWWLQLTDAIAGAHERGVVLADLSFTNVLIDDGPDGDDPDRGLVIIDLEASIREGVDEPMGLSTPGVANPNVIEDGTADRAGDWYALGALMLGSLHPVNSAVGYRPDLLPGFLAAMDADLALPAGLTGLIRDLMNPDVRGDGPDPATIRARIAALDLDTNPGWQTPVPLARPAPEPTAALRDQVFDTARGFARTIAAAADPARDDRLFPGHPYQYELNPYSVAYGAAGVLHAVRSADPVIHDLEPAPRLLHTATTWLLKSPVRPDTTPPGLYTGLAGIAWVLAEAGHREHARGLLAEAVHSPRLAAEAGVLQGRAGVGLACLRFWSRYDDGEALGWALKLGSELADTAIYSGHLSSDLDGGTAHWPDGGPGVPVGYAYGAGGVALFLLHLALATGDERWQVLGRRALNFDLAQLYQVNDVLSLFPARTAAEPGQEPSSLKTYWDEGTAGVATTLLRYLVVRPDAMLRAAWERMRPDLARGYTVMPQLFHGLSGIGMAMLDAAELIGDPRAVHEAWRTAQGVLRFVVHHDHEASLPGEQCLRESLDLATGVAGALMFLDRLLKHRPGTRTNANFVLDDLLPGRPSRER
ncbi:MAG TPA: class III lanthionine synthetase LanKC [Kribbellaceae bacterium]